MATIGQVGNVDHENVIARQGRAHALDGQDAAQSRRVDEPGGSPARRRRRQTSGGRHPVTPWGQPTRGFKTRNNKRTDKWIVTRKSEEEVSE